MLDPIEDENRLAQAQIPNPVVLTLAQILFQNALNVEWQHFPELRDPITLENVPQEIAKFERTLRRLGISNYDYLGGAIPHNAPLGNSPLVESSTGHTDYSQWDIIVTESIDFGHHLITDAVVVAEPIQTNIVNKPVIGTAYLSENLPGFGKMLSPPVIHNTADYSTVELWSELFGAFAEVMTALEAQSPITITTYNFPNNISSNPSKTVHKSVHPLWLGNVLFNLMGAHHGSQSLIDLSRSGYMSMRGEIGEDTPPYLAEFLNVMFRNGDMGIDGRADTTALINAHGEEIQFFERYRSVKRPGEAITPMELYNHVREIWNQRLTDGVDYVREVALELTKIYHEKVHDDVKPFVPRLLSLWPGVLLKKAYWMPEATPNIIAHGKLDTYFELQDQKMQLPA